MNAQGGYTYLLLLPPPAGPFPFTSVVSGRPYTAVTQYTMVEVPNFDAAVLTANGWLTVPPGVQLATDEYAGTVEPDGETITVNELGVISSTGGGGGNTLTLTADTDIAAASSVSVNSAGHAVQTWGPAPNVAGAVSPFNGPAYSNNVSPVLKLTADTFIFNYRFGAVVGTIAGKSIVYGTLNTDARLKQSAAYWPGPWDAVIQPEAAALTSSLFVTAFLDPDNNYGSVAACSIAGSGNTAAITAGTSAQVIAAPFAGQPSQPPTVIALSSTHFLLAYIDNNDQAWVVAGSVSGTTITLGTPVALSESTSIQSLGAAFLTSTTALAWFFDGSKANYVVASVSGITVTLGSAVSNTDIVNGGLTAAVLSPTLFVAVGIADNENGGIVQAGSISGTTITLGAEVNIGAEPLYSNQPFIQALGSTTFVLGNVMPGFAPTTGSVSGTTVSLESPPPINPPLIYAGQNGVSNLVNTVAQGVAPLGTNSFIFTDTYNSIYQVNNNEVSGSIAHQVLGYWFYPVSSTTVLAVLRNADTSWTTRIVTAAANIGSGPIGFVGSDVSESGTATIQISGTVPDLTDQFGAALVPGSDYFYNGDGSIVTANTGQKAGVAVRLPDSTIALKMAA